MAIFNLSKNAEFGFNMGSATVKSFTSLFGGKGTLEFVYDDGYVAGFNLKGHSDLDSVGASYAISGNRVLVTGISYYNDGEELARATALNQETTIRGMKSGTVDVTLNSGNDSFSGGDAVDVIYGGAGSDFISALRGDDVLYGDAGSDAISGGGGNDQISGGPDSDDIHGGAGRDVLRGNAGKDVFDYSLRTDSLKGIANRDVIADFQHGTDAIDLERIDANTKKRGNQEFDWIGSDDFSGTPGELRYGGGLVQGDVNGDKKVDFEIKVMGGKPTEDDFFL